jgi:hypothetical protein
MADDQGTPIASPLFSAGPFPALRPDQLAPLGLQPEHVAGLPDALGGLDTRATALEQGQTSDRITATSWADLQAKPGTFAGQGGEVVGLLGTTHNDPASGTVVSDGGIYSWSTAPARWDRIGDNSDQVVASKVASGVTNALVPFDSRLTAREKQMDQGRTGSDSLFGSDDLNVDTSYGRWYHALQTAVLDAIRMEDAKGILMLMDTVTRIMRLPAIGSDRVTSPHISVGDRVVLSAESLHFALSTLTDVPFCVSVGDDKIIDFDPVTKKLSLFNPLFNDIQAALATISGLTAGSATITGQTSMGGDASVSGALAVTKAASVSDTLAVGKSITAGSSLTVAADGASIVIHDWPDSMAPLPPDLIRGFSFLGRRKEILGFDTRNDALAPNAPPADYQLPNDLLVERGGRVGLQRYARPRNESFPRALPIFLQGPAMRPLPPRTHQLIPAGTATGSRLWAAFICWDGVPYDPNTPGGGPGANGEQLGSYIAMYSSDDQGATWVQRAQLVPPSFVTDRLADPQLGVIDGKLVLFAFAAYNSGHSAFQGTFGVVIDNPLSKSTFVATPATWLGNGVFYRLEHAFGQNFLMVDRWSAFSGFNPTPVIEAGAFLCRMGLDIDGLPYIERLSKQPDVDPSIRTYMETQVVPLTGGGFLAYRRTTLGTYSMTSPDGKTWSTPAPLDFPNAVSRTLLGRSPSGRLFRVLNKSNPGRTNLTIDFSDDEGVTWPYSLLIYPGTSSYPGIAFVGDNVYAILDTRRGQDASHIKDILCLATTESGIVGGTATIVQTLIAS